MELPDRRRARRAASLCAFAVVAMHVVAYALYYLYSKLFPYRSGDVDLIANTVISDLIAMPLCWLIFLRRMPRNGALCGPEAEREPLRASRFFFFLPCAYAVMYGGALTGRLIGALFGGFNDIITETVTTVHPLVTLLCASILAPIAEELFFRKLLIDRLSAFHPLDAILFSALLFGLMHGNLTQFLYAFPMGALFGIVYWRTKNIRYTILLHMVLNTLGGLIPVLIESLFPTQEFKSIALALYGPVVIGLFVVGLVFLIRYRRRFLPIESPLPRCRKPFYLNVGWFVACAVFTAMFVFIEFFR